jgi:hypothetical protein
MVADIENLLTEIKFSHAFRICGNDIKLRKKY